MNLLLGVNVSLFYQVRSSGEFRTALHGFADGSRRWVPNPINRASEILTLQFYIIEKQLSTFIP